MEITEECQNCRFYVEVLPETVALPEEPEPQGNPHDPSTECRRYAPRPGESASWPVVEPTDWCGDWETQAGIRHRIRRL
jgi:hypothetical protein